MIEAIRIKGDLLTQYTGHIDEGVITDLKQVNTLVGSNNSGKSRLLRNLFAEKDNIDYLQNLSEYEVKRLNNALKPILEILDALTKNRIIYGHRNQLDNFIVNIKSGSEQIKNLVFTRHLINTLDGSKFTLENQAYKSHLEQQLNQIRRHLTAFDRTYNKIGSLAKNISSTYIPVLRGLRPIAFEEDKFSNTNVYLKRTIKDYFVEGINEKTIFTGLSIFEDIKKLLLGDETERSEIKSFEYFLEKNVFKKKVILIPKYGDDVLHIKVGEGKQFPIHKLGDGLQTLIIILFPPFINRNHQHIFYIEEPETHLHPRWQRLLTRAFKLFEKHTFFITTHSSALINSPHNSVFIISQNNGRTNIHYSDIQVEKVEILKELGYKPNDLYQTNFILWVEGQSDKIYLNYLINKIDAELKEGEDYSIMFYGGSSYRHFLMNRGNFNLKFIRSLNQNYGIILDSDRTKRGEHYDKKKKEIEKLFAENKAFCWLTQLREIENYIPIDKFEEAVKKVHRLKNIKIDKSDFGDRNRIEDVDAKPSFKATIKLSTEIFSKIQINKDGTTKGISATELRKSIENSIQKTKKVTQNTDKIRVAEEIVRNGFNIKNDELGRKMALLIKEIKRANE